MEWWAAYNYKSLCKTPKKDPVFTDPRKKTATWFYERVSNWRVIRIRRWQRKAIVKQYRICHRQYKNLSHFSNHCGGILADMFNVKISQSFSVCHKNFCYSNSGCFGLGGGNNRVLIKEFLFEVMKILQIDWGNDCTYLWIY